MRTVSAVNLYRAAGRKITGLGRRHKYHSSAFGGVTRGEAAPPASGSRSSEHGGGGV